MKMKNQAADFICEKYNWDEVVKGNDEVIHKENNMLESTVPIRIVRHNAPFTLQHIRSAFSP